MRKVQRGGREERIKEVEKEPCDPSPELSTMAPKESKIKSSGCDGLHGALTNYRSRDRWEGWRDRVQDTIKDKTSLPCFQPEAPKGSLFPN